MSAPVSKWPTTVEAGRAKAPAEPRIDELSMLSLPASWVRTMCIMQEQWMPGRCINDRRTLKHVELRKVWLYC